MTIDPVDLAVARRWVGGDRALLGIELVEKMLHCGYWTFVVGTGLAARAVLHSEHGQMWRK